MVEKLPDGWRIEKVRMLGARKRAVDGNFFIGHNAQIRAIELPGGAGPAVLVTNELGDVRVYRGLPGGPAEDVPMRFVCDRTPPEGYTIGWSATGSPGQYRYLTTLPRGESGAWDLLTVYHMRGTLDLWRKRDGGPALTFDEGVTLQDARGVPDVVDWRRDGVRDLIIGRSDGSLVRLARDRDADDMRFGPCAEPVMAGTVPVDLPGPLFPCVVDWDGTGRNDLLVGTGDGYVFLFRDVGGDDGVAYDRGRRLVDARGFAQVSGPACPTLLTDGRKQFLMVADGDGVVWSWPVRRARSYVTSDLRAAFGGEDSGIETAYRKGAWWFRPHGDGVLLAAGPEPPITPNANKRHSPDVFDPPAPELTLEPPLPGTYEVHVTLVKPDDVPQVPAVEVRLSDETHTTILKPGEFHDLPRQELFFKTADLTGRKLCLRQRVGCLTLQGGLPACIESVRLVPVKPPRARKPKKHVTLAGIADSPDWYLQYRMNSPEEVDDVVGKHADAGLDIIYYKLGGGCWEYPSRIPEARSVVPDLPGMVQADRDHCARRIELQESVDRVSLTAESCHRRGMRCYGWIRIQNHGERIHGKGPLDRFYVEHPEFLDKDTLGNPVPGKLCLGYPEVREFHLQIAEEGMDLGCDGILMDTMRHLPKVMWGDPVVAEFERRHGLDMRALPPFDARVTALQTEIFTDFLRELRERMLAKRPDAELHVRVCRPYPLMGCDPGAWAREGIADEIIIEDRLEAMAPDIAGMAAVCKGTSCAAGAVFCRPTWGPERKPLHPYRVERETADWLRAGARSISFYETACIIDNVELCRAMRRINDPSALPSRLL